VIVVFSDNNQNIQQLATIKQRQFNLDSFIQYAQLDKSHKLQAASHKTNSIEPPSRQARQEFNHMGMEMK